MDVFAELLTIEFCFIFCGFRTDFAVDCLII